MYLGHGNLMVVGGWQARLGTESSFAANATAIMDADGEMLAIKFYAATAGPVTHVDFYAATVGDCTAMNLKLEIQTDDADKPSGTVVGAATANFAGQNGVNQWLGGGTDPIALGSSATLTVGSPYWLVLSRVNGTSLDGTHTIATYGVSSFVNPARIRHHNTTNWTTTAAQTGRYGFVCKVGTGYFGIPNGSISQSTATDIYDTNKQGVSVTFGCKTTIYGVVLNLTKAGTPNDLICTVYQNSISLGTITVDDASIITTIPFYIFFTTPITVIPDVPVYIILSQTGTSGSNDYDIRVNICPANYLSAALPDGMRLVYGTETPPTTAMTTEIPMMFPIIGDPATDLDGGSYKKMGVFGSGAITKESGAGARGGSGTAIKFNPSSTTVNLSYAFLVPVTASTESTLSFYHRITSSYNGTVKVTVYDSDDDATVLLNAESVSFTDDAAYHQYTSTGFTPTDTGMCRVQIDVLDGATTGDVYIDDMTVT